MSLTLILACHGEFRREILNIDTLYTSLSSTTNGVNVRMSVVRKQAERQVTLRTVLEYHVV